MKASRGRINLYKILFTDELLRKHLVEMQLFSKESLTAMLNVYDSIVIKAVYGSEEIYIFHRNNQYHIQTIDKIVTVDDKEALFATLKNETTQKYYIIQKSPPTNKLLRQFITMQRNTTLSEWFIAKKTKKTRTTFNSFICEIYFLKIRQIAIRAATKLGESFPDCYTIVLDIACDRYGDIWIYDSILHLSNSKWSQYHVLKRKNLLKKYLPDTDLLTPETFRDYINHYKTIILKPCIGQNGIGVLQITRKSYSTYEIHSGIKKIKKTSLVEAFEYIKKTYLDNSDYIVQRRIALATINKSPIDLRVVTQKVSGVWNITGKIVKVAGEHFFITNAAQKLLTLDQAIIDAKIRRNHIKNFDTLLNNICFLASTLLDETFGELNIIGFDIGITKRGNMWIIEGNKVPDIKMFRELEDKTMYQTILKIRNEEK
ncbi:YheC/YheD family protein [Rummeliibacillus sp. NPDC094406]|uniref:YheC/YheD family protein n=1 Tax=Rummeliibacillus sp. NPDC094406 TaxID=3364511 RepID=UPI0038059AD2